MGGPPAHGARARRDRQAGPEDGYGHGGARATAIRPPIADQYRAAIALLEGRLHEAERAAERSRRWGRLLGGRDASGTYGIQMFGIRREQGRLAELAPVARSLAAGSGGGGVWRPAVAALLAELGMVEGSNVSWRTYARGASILCAHRSGSDR